MRELVKRGVRTIGAATVVATLGLGGCGGAPKAEPQPTGSNRELVEWRAAALTPPLDSSYSRTRLLEDLAVALFAHGKEQEAFEAVKGSVTAQALKAPTATAVTRIGRARLLVDGRRWADALMELKGARVAGAEEYAELAADAQLAQKLKQLGKAAEARSHFETIAKRYLRSAGSAQIRRAAEQALAR